jgi:hypothetical protein
VNVLVSGFGLCRCNVIMLAKMIADVARENGELVVCVCTNNNSKRLQDANVWRDRVVHSENCYFASELTGSVPNVG